MNSRDVPARVIGWTLYLLAWPGLRLFVAWENRRLRQEAAEWRG
jgi:hypothetical protein